MVICLFGIHWAMLHRVIELLASWKGKFCWHQNISSWRFVLHWLMWSIWRERNATCFEGCERSILQIKAVFIFTLLEWSLVLPTYSRFNWFLLSGFLILAPIVNFQCTWVDFFHYLFINKLFFIIYPKKKKKEDSVGKWKRLYVCDKQTEWKTCGNSLEIWPSHSPFYTFYDCIPNGLCFEWGTQWQP